MTRNTPGTSALRTLSNKCHCHSLPGPGRLEQRNATAMIRRMIRARLRRNESSYGCNSRPFPTLIYFRIDATEDVNQISSFPRTIAEDTTEGSVIPNEPTNSRKRRRSFSPGESESCTRQRSAMESSSRNTIVPDPLPFETLLSGLWPFDNAAFCSAFSAEQTSHPDLSLPLEIELFDPSQLFADFDAMTATQGEINKDFLLFIIGLTQLTGVQDHTALHLNPSLHIPSISNLTGVQDYTALHPNPSLHIPPISNLIGVQDPTALHPNSLLDIPSISNDPGLTSHDEQSCECFRIIFYNILTPSPSVLKLTRISAFRAWFTQCCRPCRYARARF